MKVGQSSSRIIVSISHETGAAASYLIVYLTMHGKVKDEVGGHLSSGEKVSAAATTSEKRRPQMALLRT